MTTILQDGGFTFEVVDGWGRVPEGLKLGDEIPGVATDSRDRVYVFNRSEHPVAVFESDGRFLGTWGENVLSGRPHGITITHDDVVWCTDDGNHTVRKFTLEGKLLQTLGTANQPSASGYVPGSKHPLSSIKRGAAPFNRPTKVAVAPNGDLYITDGYGNARVHRFSSSGDLIQSWGEPGEGPGEFNLPHTAWVHTDGRVFVCDRENSRIQIFSPTGTHLNTWNVEGRPQELAIDRENRVFISLLLWIGGAHTMAGKVMPRSAQAHLRICDLDGNLLAKFGATNYGEMDSFVSAHGMCIDSQGNWYVVETGQRGLERLGVHRPDYPSIRKLARVR
jgi:DNA-binding beta-propeller fold protein YncE